MRENFLACIKHDLQTVFFVTVNAEGRDAAKTRLFKLFFVRLSYNPTFYIFIICVVIFVLMSVCSTVFTLDRE